MTAHESINRYIKNQPHTPYQKIIEQITEQSAHSDLKRRYQDRLSEGAVYELQLRDIDDAKFHARLISMVIASLGDFKPIRHAPPGDKKAAEIVFTIPGSDHENEKGIVFDHLDYLYNTQYIKISAAIEVCKYLNDRYNAKILPLVLLDSDMNSHIYLMPNNDSIVESIPNQEFLFSPKGVKLKEIAIFLATHTSEGSENTIVNLTSNER